MSSRSSEMINALFLPMLTKSATREGGAAGELEVGPVVATVC